MKYKVASGKVTVKARSRVHDTTTVWNQVSGDAEADAETLATTGATATFRVDMTKFDAGDFLKNRKLRGDFDLGDDSAHPQATFELRKVTDVVREGPKFTATAEGVLRWRGKEVVVSLAGHGKLDAVSLEASATFPLDIRKLGLSAPRFLMFKMEDEVTIEVTVGGVPA